MTEENIAIVTGAGSGIGQQAAIRLAANGYRIALVGRTENKLSQTAQLLAQGNHGNKTDYLILPSDLCHPEAGNQIIGEVLDRYGRIDVLANVAGDAPYLPVDEYTPQTIQRCIDTNLTAVVKLVSAAWAPLKSQGGGVIVNVSSMAAFEPFPFFSVYAATKAGLNMYTRCIAAEGAEYGIEAVSIAPGAVETPMLRALFDESAIPADKTLDPGDVADVIVGCITGQRAFEPGETIPLPSQS